MDPLSWNYLSILYFASAILSGGLAYYALRHRNTPAAEALAQLMGAIAWWTVFEALLLVVPDLDSKLVLLKLQYLGIVATPVLWLFFALEFSRLGVWLTPRRKLALFVLPVVTLAAVWTLEHHRLYYKAYEVLDYGTVTLFRNDPGVLYWVNAIYAYAVFSAGILVLVRQYLRAARPNRSQIGTFLFGAAFPIVGNIIYNFVVSPRIGMDLTPVFFMLSGLVITWGVFHYDLLGIMPIAREIVLENLQDAIMVLDLENRVVDVNRRMTEIIGTPAVQVIGQPCGETLKPCNIVVEKFQDAEERRVELLAARDGTPADYELLVSSLVNQQGQKMGWLVMLRDISARRKANMELDAQREIAESLRETMMTISSRLDLDAIVGEILAQLKRVIPYYTAALYRLDDDGEMKVVRVVGPDQISGRSYTTPRRYDQVVKIFQLKQAEIFISAHTEGEEGVEPVYSSMAAALAVGDDALGVLTIDRYEQKPFDQQDAEILQAFANQAAIAIKNAELYQEARTVAVIQERNRLAQDLHDAVNQTLFTASIMAEAIPQVWETDPEQARQGLAEVRDLTRGALAEMRTLLYELRPHSLTEKKFGLLLDSLGEAFSSRNRAPVEMQIYNDAVLPPDAQVILYRIAQEAFNNITKHAETTEVEVCVDAFPEQIYFYIKDDGVGFEIDEAKPGHFGLEIMRERASEIGARLTIASEAGKGTIVELVWPETDET